MGLVNNAPVRYISVKDCPYSIEGNNLAEMRRARLRKIAIAISVSAEGSKQDILKRVIGRLKASGAPKELNDL